MLAFGRRYCAAFQGKFGWDFSGSSNLSELNTVLRCTFLVRRLKKDVMRVWQRLAPALADDAQQLPAKTRSQIIVDMPPKPKALILQLMKQVRAMLACLHLVTGAAGAAVGKGTTLARR